jgi:glutamine synthetase
MTNLQFLLTFFINTIKAVNDYEALLRAAIATASNDHRLGAMKRHQQLPLCLLRTIDKVLAELEGVTTGKLSPEEKTDLN